MKKKKIYIYIIFVITTVLAIYLNRSYAYIYDKITSMPLPASNIDTQYTIEGIHADTRVYVAIGDSLTAGVGVKEYKDSYPYQIAQKISQDKNTIILKPFAIPGAQTKDITNKMLQDIVDSNPDIVTILLGVNDIHGGVSKEEFIQNYKVILDRITSSTYARVYVINIPYIGASSLILPPHNLYFKNKTKDFNSELKELVETYSSVSYIDLYSQTLDIEDEKSYYASDLFHPGIVGYSLWASYMYDNFNY